MVVSKWRNIVSDNDFVIIPSRDNHAYDEMTDASVELSRKTTGTLFRKHILNVGKDLIHPSVGRMTIDDAFVKSLKDNFTNKACDIVQVPLANDKNQHVEDPDRNVGEVVDIEVKDNKVYAVIDARRNADRFRDKTYLGASAMIAMNYTDTNTGNKVGPTLCHVAVTNRPYITNLEDYEEIVKASADNSDEAVLLTEPATETIVDVNKGSVEEPEVEEHKTMTKEELIAALKAEHGVDVAALQADAEKPATDTTELSNKLVSALTDAGVVKLSADNAEANVEQVVGAVVELANDNVKLSTRVETLELSNAKILATSEVDTRVREGFIEPAKRDTMIKLYLSNQDLYTELLPEKPVVELSAERGTSTEASENKVEEVDVDAEIARLSQINI
jgi:predicted RNA-binding Zn ribbon-like protein